MATILLVEDDDALATGLLFALQGEGFAVLHAKTAAQARERFAADKADLVLLDVTLPDGNGFALCREFRAVSKLPIVFLTACDEEVEIVMGLDGGGDDYITKPFRLRELLSRIKAQLRRATSGESDLCAGALRLLPEQGKAICNETDIYLTATELRLLALFVANKGQTLTRRQLLDRLWDNKGEFVDDNTLSVHVRHLREKLSAADNSPSILTVRGVGYRMEVRL